MPKPTESAALTPAPSDFSAVPMGAAGPPPFAADIRQWPTVADFAAHLAKYDPAICAWTHGITLHHTVIPLASQWRGAHTMQGLASYYQGLGWSGWPHLFFVAGSPDLAQDGIWQGNPLNLPGIHAVSFNATHLGFEVVGSYDSQPWPPALRGLVLGCLAVALRWLGLPASCINGHRDDPLTTKSCPGRSIDLNAVRADVAALLAASEPVVVIGPAPSIPPAPLIYTADSPLMGVATLTAEDAAQGAARRGSAYGIDDLRIIAGYVWDGAASVGLNADLVWAQMLHETANLSAWWCLRPRRNPAGIGVTGNTRRTRPASVARVAGGVTIGMWAIRDDGLWAEGLSFPTWEGAVRGHLGRLLLYVQGAGGDDDQRAMAAWARACRSLDIRLWGSATTLIALGAAHNVTGLGWASPGAAYGAGIAAVAGALAAGRADPATQYRVSATSGARVRHTPTRAGAMVRSLAAGTRVTVESLADGEAVPHADGAPGASRVWASISAPAVGWVFAELLRRAD